MQSQISSLESHLSSQRDRKQKLQTSIVQTQKSIDSKLVAQKDYAEKLDAQARLNGPELAFWETYLGCRIEGAGDSDLIRVTYSFPPEKNSSSKGNSDGNNRREGNEERDAQFELHIPDSGSGGYKVVYTNPKLNNDKIEKVVRKLNETRDIAVLLKGMRSLFGEEMTTGETRMVMR